MCAKAGGSTRTTCSKPRASAGRRSSAVAVGELGVAPAQRRTAVGIGDVGQSPAVRWRSRAPPGSPPGSSGSALRAGCPRRLSVVVGNSVGQGSSGACSSASKRFHQSSASACDGVRRRVLVRIDVAQDDAGLDRAVPAVHLEPHRGIDRLLLADAELERPKATPSGAVGAAVEVEAGVLSFADRPHVAHPGRWNEQSHAGIAHAERAPASAAPRPGRGRVRHHRPSRRSARSDAGPRC